MTAKDSLHRLIDELPDDQAELARQLLESQMGGGEEYWQAYRRWTELEPMDLDAANRLTRDEAHARR